MRTTVEISDDLRARLLALAARRGERGFSRIVEEALERYLDTEGDPARSRRVRDAIAVLGTLPATGAAPFRDRVRRLRRRWRA